MIPASARQFIEAVKAHDFDAAERFLDRDVETVTPRDTFHGIAACRQVLHKASGDEQFAIEQSDTVFDDVEGDVLARTLETARWRESGDVAYERQVAVRLTLDRDRIVKVVVMPGGAPPPQVDELAVDMLPWVAARVIHDVTADDLAVALAPWPIEIGDEIAIEGDPWPLELVDVVWAPSGAAVAAIVKVRRAVLYPASYPV